MVIQNFGILIAKWCRRHYFKTEGYHTIPLFCRDAINRVFTLGFKPSQAVSTAFRPDFVVETKHEVEDFEPMPQSFIQTRICFPLRIIAQKVKEMENQF